jgi:hypothetical protein
LACSAVPPRERLVIENVPPNEWLAFREALAEDDHQVGDVA